MLNPRKKASKQIDLAALRNAYSLAFCFAFALTLSACDVPAAPGNADGEPTASIEADLSRDNDEGSLRDAEERTGKSILGSDPYPGSDDPTDIIADDPYPALGEEDQSAPDAYPDPATRAPGGRTTDGDMVDPRVNPSARRTTRHLPYVASYPQSSPPLDPDAATQSGTQSAAQPTGPCAGIVTSDGGRLVLAGEPFAFFGINVHFLLDEEFPEARMESIVRDLSQRGVSVIRVWFFHDEDPERFARLLDLGETHGVRFIVTLTDNVFKGKDWFGGDEDKKRFRPHLERTVSRFKDRHEILYWELANEPNCGESFGEECMDTIKDWLTGRSKTVRAIDACHLVSTGMIGAGNYDFERDEYRRIHRRETIGVVSAHRRTDESREREIEIAEELDRPIVYGEIYDKAHEQDCQPLDGGREMNRRAGRVKDDLRDALGDGIDGYVLWAFAAGGVQRSNGTTKYYCGPTDYELSDPLWQTLAEDPGLLPTVPWRP